MRPRWPHAVSNWANHTTAQSAAGDRVPLTGGLDLIAPQNKLALENTRSIAASLLQKDEESVNSS
jgi:hypothetical protein